MIRHVFLVARREFAGYVTTPFGWVIAGLVLLADGILFQSIALRGERTSTEVVRFFFYFSFVVTLAASVFLAMRTFAAERERGTLVLLFTSPLKEWELVLGKYLGALGFLYALVLATVYMPLLVMVHGNLQSGQVVAGYLGLFFVGAAATAMGLFASALARNQVTAVFLGAVILVFFVFCYFLGTATDPPFKGFFAYMGLFNRHFIPIMDGAVHLRALVLYATLAVGFLLGSVRVLEARRWR